MTYSKYRVGGAAVQVNKIVQGGPLNVIVIGQSENRF